MDDQQYKIGFSIYYITCDLFSLIALLQILIRSRKQMYCFYEILVRKILIWVGLYCLLGLYSNIQIFIDQSNPKFGLISFFIVGLLQNFSIVQSMAWTVCISYIMKNELYGKFYEEELCTKVFKIYSFSISLLMTMIVAYIFVQYEKLNYIEVLQEKFIERLIHYQIIYICTGLMFIFGPLCYFQYFTIKQLITFSREVSLLVKRQIQRLLIFPVIILFCIFSTQILLLINACTQEKITILTQIFFGIQKLYGLFQSLAYGWSIIPEEESLIENDHLYQSQITSSVLLNRMEQSQIHQNKGKSSLVVSTLNSEFFSQFLISPNEIRSASNSRQKKQNMEDDSQFENLTKLQLKIEMSKNSVINKEISDSIDSQNGKYLSYSTNQLNLI